MNYEKGELEQLWFNLARCANRRERQSPDWHYSRAARKAAWMRQIKAKLLVVIAAQEVADDGAYDGAGAGGGGGALG
jgi:ribosomal protein S19E (S16A)